MLTQHPLHQVNHLQSPHYLTNQPLTIPRPNDHSRYSPSQKMVMCLYGIIVMDTKLWYVRGDESWGCEENEVDYVIDHNINFLSLFPSFFSGAGHKLKTVLHCTLSAPFQNLFSMWGWWYQMCESSARQFVSQAHRKYVWHPPHFPSVLILLSNYILTPIRINAKAVVSNESGRYVCVMTEARLILFDTTEGTSRKYITHHPSSPSPSPLSLQN